MPTKATVAALRTRPERVLDDYARLTQLAGARDFLAPNTTTILKDNISWHFPFPAANTTPWQLEGTVKALRAEGFDDLVCVQNKTVVTDAFKGEDLNGYLPIFKGYGIPVLYNFKDEDMRWVRIEPTAKMLVLDRIFPEGIHVPDFFFGKNIVHLPTIKCHIYTTTTGAMKNAFGGLLNTRRHYTHSWIHETLVDLLAIQKEIHSGIFAVMDGTTAGNGPGPRTMYPEIKNVVLASGDQVAIDAVAAKLMGFDPLTIPYIRLAHERGLGVGDPRDIDLVGDTDLANESWNFRVGDNGASRIGDIVWFGALKPVQNVLMRTPLVNLFILGSEVYHDYYRWPARDRRVFESWLANTPWGQMFQQYHQQGVLGGPQLAPTA
ncbi:MAG TPA: DUF362 domain-containing protein [Chloroflexota bacterium]|jgi:uncharacterized protein (DUF362 family)|nr:DUF362 domain-containing protein [Chloroflexota bacterium]